MTENIRNIYSTNETKNEEECQVHMLIGASEDAPKLSTLIPFFESCWKCQVPEIMIAFNQGYLSELAAQNVYLPICPDLKLWGKCRVSIYNICILINSLFHKLIISRTRDILSRLSGFRYAQARGRDIINLLNK